MSISRPTLHASLLVIGCLAVAVGPARAVMPLPGGDVPSELTQSFDAGLFKLPARHSGLSTSAVQTAWSVPVILVAFSDQPFSTTLYGGKTPGQHFEMQLFDSSGVTATGSVYDYFKWTSNGRVRVVGKVVATVTLANTKDFYANNTWGQSMFAPRNTYGFVSAALQQADAVVDWRPYDQDRDGYVDMVWVVHSGLAGEAPPVARNNLWSITSRLTAWPGGERYKTQTPMVGAPAVMMSLDRFSVLPEMSSSRPGQLSEIGVYCHEFGHALGLPDLYDTRTWGGTTGPGNWNLMSTGGYGTDGGSPEYPAHLGAWSLLYLGWRSTIRPAADADVLHTPLAAGDPIVEFWFQGESNPEHFLIENRRREGFDRRIPGEGLLVYRVNESVMTQGVPSNQVNGGVVPGLQLMEADGRNDLAYGSNRGEASDMFPGPLNRTRFDDTTVPSTRSYAGGTTQIALSGITRDGADIRYQIQVRAPGWWPITQVNQSSFQPVLPSGPAGRAVLLANRSIALVTNEPVAGRPQVMLRTRSPEGVWAKPIQVSLGSGTASDPTVVALGRGEDLLFIWSDSRHGPAELYGRWRIHGRWLPERRLTDLTGDSRYPSAAVDKTGRIYLTWLCTQGGPPQVRFATFLNYFTPLPESPLAVTPAGDTPGPPLVVAGSDSLAHILWSDRTASPARIRIARFSGTTGLGAIQKLSHSSYEQPSMDAAVDGAGLVHVVWQESGAGLNEIHYQRRLADGRTSTPVDTVIVNRGEVVQNPTIRVDSESSLHIGYIANRSGVNQVRYLRCRESGGWDYSSTELTLIADGTAARPALVPLSPTELTALFVGFKSGETRLYERRRGPAPAIVAVGPLPFEPSPAAPRLTFASSNPLRAGDPLRIEAVAGSHAAGGQVDLFDLGGRRITSVSLRSRGADAIAEVPGEATRAWPSGVYFAQLRGRQATTARLVVIR